MKNVNIILLAIISLVGVLWTSCQRERTPDEVLVAAKKAIEQAKTIHYAYNSIWDNRFNESIFEDSATIVYTKLDSSFHQLGFYAQNRNFDFLYDGKDYLEINHDEKQIVLTSSNEVEGDSSFFAHSMLLSYGPREFFKEEQFDYKLDTIIASEKYYVYKQVEYSKSQEGKPMTQEVHYCIQTPSNLLMQTKNIIIINNDTVQIITYNFKNYRLEPDSYDFSKIDRSSFANYSTISNEEKYKARNQKLIAVGDRLKKKAYKDILDNDVALYGTENDQTVIMFSFIGCGGCEYAVREMKAKNYNFKKGTKLYYSSPRDSKTVLKKYLDKKAFPSDAFGEESKMNDDFSVYSFPTFVVIDKKGQVEKVVFAYDEEVENLLFD